MEQTYWIIEHVLREGQVTCSYIYRIILVGRNPQDQSAVGIFTLSAL